MKKNFFMSSLLIFFILFVCSYLFSSSAYAYTDGLLNGKALNWGYDKDNSSSLVTGATDNNEATLHKLELGYNLPLAKDTIWYKFAKLVNVNGYKARTSIAGTLYLYDANDVLIRQIYLPVQTGSNTAVITIPLVENVSKVAIVNASTNSNMNLYEADVFGVESPPDLIPPAIPTGLTVNPGDHLASLHWTSPTDIDFSGVNIYEGATKIAGPITGTSYTATGLTNGTSYSFSISAVDSTGNESAKSSTVSATPFDTTPPVAEDNFV